MSTTSNLPKEKSLLQRLKNTTEMKNLRRSLRNDSTPAEIALWKLLKGKKVANLQFRRQFSIGRYILDFYCPAIHLAIELDGGYHGDEEVFDKDIIRDEVLLRDYNITTLRFENSVVFKQPEAIIKSIELYTQKEKE